MTIFGAVKLLQAADTCNTDSFVFGVVTLIGVDCYPCCLVFCGAAAPIVVKYDKSA